MVDKCILKSLKKGELFTIQEIENPKASQVYVKDYYDKSAKKFYCYKFDDMNSSRFFKSDKIVFTGFTF